MLKVTLMDGTVLTTQYPIRFRMPAFITVTIGDYSDGTAVVRELHYTEVATIEAL